MGGVREPETHGLVQTEPYLTDIFNDPKKIMSWVLCAFNTLYSMQACQCE